MTDRLKAKCTSCGHVWTLLYLPVTASVVSKFTKLPCPKCHAPKPVMAGNADLSTEDQLRALLFICQHVLPPASDAMVIWAAIAPEDTPLRHLLHTLADDEADARTMCGKGWRVGKFQEVPHG